MVDYIKYNNKYNNFIILTIIFYSSNIYTIILD